MDAGAIEQPVAQSDVPGPQSVPFTPLKSSAQNSDAEPTISSSDDEDDLPSEFDDVELVSPTSKEPRVWNLLGEWNIRIMLQSEIDARITHLATTYMEESGLVELPTVNRMPGENLGLWQQFSIVFKNDGERTIETYHCPLRERCRCPCQIRIIRDSSTTKLLCSGGAHTQERCHSAESYRRWEQVGCWEFPKRLGLLRKQQHLSYEQIDAQIEELAHDWMNKSRLLAHPDHVPGKWDLGMWILLNEYTKYDGTTLVRLYRCPMWKECGCRAGIRIKEGGDYITMDICGSHDKKSHSADGDHYLVKGRQIIRASDVQDEIEIIREPAGK